jgi:hypothetical protein
MAIGAARADLETVVDSDVEVGEARFAVLQHQRGGATP